MQSHWLDEWENSRDDDDDGEPSIRIQPIGPWRVLTVDDDGTYELSDLGMAKHHPMVSNIVWVSSFFKLKKGKIYEGYLAIDETHKKLPLFLPILLN